MKARRRLHSHSSSIHQPNDSNSNSKTMNNNPSQINDNNNNNGPISEVDDYVLQTILSKLPAKAFASAACVNRNWNHLCSRILSHPSFISTFSLNTSLSEAVNEVVGKVLSKPIRPRFAILSICPSFDLDEAHNLIVEKLGSKIPIVTCETDGIVGKDAFTDKFSEVKFPYFHVDEYLQAHTAGISLTVGDLPGLKVDLVPLINAVQGHVLDEFVTELRDFSASVSGHSSPEAIIMFGDSEVDMKPVLEKLDCTLSQHTVIAGNGSCNFRYSSINSTIVSSKNLSYVAVALVFAKEKRKVDGVGKIGFHFAVGAGVSAVGPIYKVVSAKMRKPEFATWLTARREGEHEILDGEQMLNDFELEMGDPVPHYDLYIGVKKRRKYSIGPKQVKSVTSVAYHHVQEGDEQYLYVQGWDIKTGDTFCFHIPDETYALDSCASISENFSKLKHKEMIGGFVFSCFGRGESYFGRPNVDSSPILDNFPNIPLAGMLCGGEIGRGHPDLGQSDEAFGDSHLHVYSSIYLLMSYTPPCTAP